MTVRTAWTVPTVRTARRTAAALAPPWVRRILGFDLKGLVSLVLWAGRRRHGVPPGAVAVSYSGAQTMTMAAFLFALVVELAVADVVLREFGAPPALRTTILVIDGYSVLLVLAVIAACVTRPHVVTGDQVRLRYGVFFDLTIPRGLITGVRGVRGSDEKGLVRVEGDGLSIAVAAQTNLVLELSEKITAVRPLGGRAGIRSVRFFADDPGAAMRALTTLPGGGAAGPPDPAVSPGAATPG